MMSMCLAAVLSVSVGVTDSGATPYEIDPVTDGVLTGASAVFLVIMDGLVKSSLVTNPSCDLVASVNYCDPGRLNALDASVVGNDSETWRDLSNVGIGVVYGLPLVLGLFDSLTAETTRPWADWGTDLLVVTEAGLLTSVATSTFKYALRRPRPTQYHPDMPNRFGAAEHQLSFPSGHTSVAAAVASAYAMTYGLRHPDSNWRWAVYAGAGAAAVFTGYARIAAGMHFYTDVLGGLALGTAVGILVPWIHRKGVQVLPTVHAADLSVDAGPGVTVSMRF